MICVFDDVAFGGGQVAGNMRKMILRMCDLTDGIHDIQVAFPNRGSRHN